METPKTHTQLTARLFAVLPLIAALAACGGSSSSSSGDDTATPKVSSVNPADSATEVDRNKKITAHFNTDIFATTVDNASFTLSAGSAVTGSVSFDGVTNTASFAPTTDLMRLTTYTATLKTDITDLSGMPLAAPYTWSFTTADGTWSTPELLETNSEDAVYPQIAFDDSGNALAVWNQDDGSQFNIWSNRYTSGAGWGTPKLVETDNAGGTTDPQIAFDNNGDALAVWSQSDGTRFNIWSNRYIAGAGWGTPELVETNNSGNAFRPEIEFDDSGNALAVWTQYDGTRFNIWSNRYTANSGWGTAELIETDNAGAAFFPQIAIDGSGNALVVWYQSDGTRNNIWSNHYTLGTGWGMAELIETDNAGLAGLPKVAFDGNGNALAVWYQSDGTRNNIWSNHYTPSTGWGTPILVETDNSGGASNPELAFDNSGNALAVWSQSDGTDKNTWSNRYTPAGGWGTPVLIETSDNGDSLFSPVAFDDNGNALAIWQRDDGTRTNIWFNRYTSAGGWGTAKLIETDDIDDAKYPEIAIDGSGNALAVWQQDDGAYTNIRSSRFQ